MVYKGHFHWFAGASVLNGSQHFHSRIFLERLNSFSACMMTSSICPQLIFFSKSATVGSLFTRAALCVRMVSVCFLQHEIVIKFAIKKQFTVVSKRLACKHNLKAFSPELSSFCCRSKPIWCEHF